MNFMASGRWLILIAVFCLGCEPDSSSMVAKPADDLFAPKAMRVHPIFTQVAAWTNSGKPDGIEAQLEFTDQFDDPTKASGNVLFELFDYTKDSPEVRGKRLGRWVGSLSTLADQHERWNTTLRTYRFQLDYPAVSLDQSYVLTAVFELSGGGRFFDRIVITGRPPQTAPHKSDGGVGLP